ncbi:MAG TPA: glycosyltransferase [Bacteroidetes bacterium]|nr:glycosyltransferase [Bacteroidota bacterium]
MQKGKVTIIGTAYPLRGGLAAYNERLARAFMQHGYETVIHTFSLQYPGFLFPGKTQYAQGSPPGELNILVTINSVHPLNWQKVGRRIRKERPDIVIIKFWTPFMAPCLGTLARIIRRNRHTRVISILDNVIPHERHFYDLPLIRYFTGSVDGFIGMSESVLTDLARFNTSSPRAFCPHPLYDHFGQPVTRNEALQELELDPSYRYLLFFGFIRDYKGLDLLLRAFASVRKGKHPLKLLVAGEFYTDPGPYREIIEKNRMQEDVVLHTEFIPDEKVRYFFCAADLVVQPYKTATQSGVTQIAYHFDRPMVVTRTGGLAEMVPHGRAGYITEQAPEAITAAILDFFDRGRFQEMSDHVAEIKKTFSWERMVNTVEKVANESNS